MNLLLDFLKTRRSVRWLSHLLGILAGAGILGFAGETWSLAGQKAGAAVVVVLVLEVLVSLGDAKQRRLKRIAPDCFPLKNLGSADRDFVQRTLARSPQAAFWRTAGVWVLALFGMGLLGAHGPLYRDAMFVSLAAPIAALTAGWGGHLTLKRVLPFFYFEEDYAKNLGVWLPSLALRLRRSVVAPVVVVVLPLLAAFGLALPLSLPALVWIAAWGVATGLGAMWVLDSLAIEPITHLNEALRRFGHGDLQALLDVTSGDEIGHATEAYNKTLRAVDKRFFVLENFGHSVAPGKSDALFEGGLRLDGEKRAVALMEVAWHNAGASTKALEAPLQLSTLNRFYEAVQDAVEKAQGGVLHLGEGRVLAIWGAPLADEQPVNGALAAAWSLQATLKVWANQQRLRGGEAPQWGLGVSTGQATVGLVGPKHKQRYSVLGGPADEVQALAQRGGGPWLDERSAAAAKAPFAVQISQTGPQLIAGPEPEAPSAEALGFSPGSKL